MVHSQPCDEGDSARENKSHDDDVEKTAKACFTLLLWSGENLVADVLVVVFVLLTLDTGALARETGRSGGRWRLVGEEGLGFVVLEEVAGLGDWRVRRW